MAEEIRRSGRATKGQHTKNSDDDLTPSAAKAKPQQASKGKGKGRGGKAVSNEPEPEEAEAVIRCVCAINDDDYEGTMVCCETCEAWQHNLCMGISEDESQLPEKYWCERCKPEDHVDLVEAMKRGEKPWEERKRQKVEDERLKKQKKGKRKSGARPSAATSVADDTPVKQPLVETGSKRKFEALGGATSPQGLETQSSATAPIISSPTNLDSTSGKARKSSAVSSETTAKRRKSGVEITPTETVAPRVEDISGLPADRQKAAKAMQSALKQLIDKAVKDAAYRIPDGETATSISQKHALQIEQALTNVYGTPSDYSAQFRSILFNIKKNPELVAGILSSSLSAIELAEMSTEDMASEDLQRQRAVIKEQADKQVILISEQSGPRIRKTHKGEELIGEDDIPMGESSYNAAPVRRRETLDDASPSSPAEGPNSPNVVELPDDVGRPSLSVDTTSRRQSNFDITQAWKSAHSPDQPVGDAPPVRRSTGADYSSQERMVEDADVDRLLNDEDITDAASPPITDGSFAWSGKVDMAGVASFKGTARWAAGGDIGQKIPYTDLLPRTMEISGRIPITVADEYVGGMRFSQTSDVCVLALSAQNSQADQDGLATIFNYFHAKDRWGVIHSGSWHEAIRDVYVVTLEAGKAEYPQFLQTLEFKDIEEPRPENMLLLTLVAKTKSAVSSGAGTTAIVPQTATAVPTDTPLSGTPVIPQFSPVTLQAPFNNGHGVASAPLGPPGPNEESVRILGPFINAVVVQQILTAVPNMTEMQLHNLRDVLEREPAAREDINKLGEHLIKRVSEAAK